MNRTKTGLSVPCQWDQGDIERILQLKAENGIEIKEMYGTLSSSKIPHGRALEVTRQINREDALKVKSMIDQAGLKFAYLLNAPIESSSYSFLKEELDWIIQVFQADSITVSSLKVMEYICSFYPEQKINVSTIAGIKNVSDARRFMSIEPNKMVTHHDVNRSYDCLKELVAFTEANGIELEIMVNESCLRNCKRREEHYSTLATGCGDDGFHSWCNTIKISHPYQLLLANFIRPEDVGLYEELGVKLFKVTGRSKPLGWLYDVVKAYLDRSYEGNLIRLLGIDPRLGAEKWLYIDNKSLEHFMEGFPKNSDAEIEKNYCEEFILKLYQDDVFHIDNTNIVPEIKESQLRSRIEKGIYN